MMDIIIAEMLVSKNSKHCERSEEHTSELQSPVPISYAVFCLKKKKKKKKQTNKELKIYKIYIKKHKTFVTTM